METIDIEQLEKAVLVFYDSCKEQQTAAHNFVTEAQKSRHAWQFAWVLMQPQKPQKVQFYGAVTLHLKLLNAWHEVPIEHREELKQKILEKIVEFATGPKLVLNRLCIALSVVIVHTILQWPTAVEDVISLFQNNRIPNVSQDTQMWIMFEILRGIPDELRSVITTEKRDELRHAINRGFPSVMQLVDRCLRADLQLPWPWQQGDSHANVTHVVSCIGAWFIGADYEFTDVISITQTLLDVVNKCYWPCMQERERDQCMTADECELAETCMRVITCIIDVPQSQHYEKTVLTIVSKILHSLSPITKSEWRKNNNNEDIVMNIYTLYLAIMDRHSRFIFGGIISSDQLLTHVYISMVEELLKCTDKPGIYPVEESCSSVGLGFWYMLEEEVMGKENADERMRYFNAVRPIFVQLTRILMRKAEEPNVDQSSTWSAEDFENFRCYRQDIADTFMYCCDILSCDIIPLAMANFDAGYEAVRLDARQWPKLEAAFFAFYCVAEHASVSQAPEVYRFLQAVFSFPYERFHVKLLSSALETAANMCIWLRRNPQYIPGAIKLFIRGLNSTVNTPATFALKELCSECKGAMRPYAKPVLDACHTILVSGRLRNSECVRLMYSIGSLMSLVGPEEIPNYLDAYVAPCFQEMQEKCTPGAEKTAEARIRTIFRLNMVGALFTSLNTETKRNHTPPPTLLTEEPEPQQEDSSTSKPVQPVLLIIARTMPLFRSVVEFWVDEIEVIEAACNVMKYAVNNLRNSFLPMLDQLCYFIAALFQTQCCTPVIEMSKTVAVMYYREEECQPRMQQLIRELMQVCLVFVEAVPEENLSNIADTIESFYHAVAAFAKKMPESFNDNGINCQRIILNALKAMKLPENGPIRASVTCISCLITQARSADRIGLAIQTTGQCILDTVMHCVSAITPRQQIEKFADIYLALNKTYPAEYPRWLKNIFTIYEADNLLTAEKRAKYMNILIREKHSKRVIQYELQQFAKEVRGLTEKFE